MRAAPCFTLAFAALASAVSSAICFRFRFRFRFRISVQQIGTKILGSCIYGYLRPLAEAARLIRSNAPPFSLL